MYLVSIFFELMRHNYFAISISYSAMFCCTIAVDIAWKFFALRNFASNHACSAAARSSNSINLRNINCNSSRVCLLRRTTSCSDPHNSLMPYRAVLTAWRRHWFCDPLNRLLHSTAAFFWRCQADMLSVSQKILCCKYCVHGNGNDQCCFIVRTIRNSSLQQQQ